MTDPGTIQREIEVERAGLRNSLRALDQRLSPEHLVDRAADLLQVRGGDAADAAVKMAKDNPVAVALIGTGLAWLVAGTATSRDQKTPPPAPAPSSAAYDPRTGQTAPGLAQPEPPMAGFDARVAAAERAMTQPVPTKGDTEMTTAATHDSDITATAKSRTQAIRDRAERSAKAMRERINEGMENMPEAARERILSARLAAIDAQAAVEARIQRASDSARRSMHDNPMLIGVLALAAGAALGAALPRTSAENRSLGAHRDRLFDEAERVFREETAKLRSVAEAAVEEGRAAVKDTLKNGPPTEDDPAERVSKAAKGEARKQELGRVS